MEHRRSFVSLLVCFIVAPVVSGVRDAAGPAPISSKIFPGKLPGTPGGLGFPGALQDLPTKHNSDDKAELLFVQHARSATLQYTEISETERRGKLVMEGVSPSVTYFSDKPLRMGGQLGAALWTSQQFNGVWAVPPNAALYGMDANGPHTVVVTLYDPKYDAEKATMSFNVTVIGEHTDARASKDVSSYSLPTVSAFLESDNSTTLDNVALFVDNVGVPFTSTTGAGYTGSTACLLAPGCLSPLICGVYCCDWQSRSSARPNNQFCGY